MTSRLLVYASTHKTTANTTTQTMTKVLILKSTRDVICFWHAEHVIDVGRLSFVRAEIRIKHTPFDQNTLKWNKSKFAFRLISIYCGHIIMTYPLPFHASVSMTHKYIMFTL